MPLCACLIGQWVRTPGAESLTEFASVKCDSLLYPGLIPVASVSWMLLSAGAKLEPRSGLGGKGCLLSNYLPYGIYVGVLLCESE